MVFLPGGFRGILLWVPRASGGVSCPVKDHLSWVGAARFPVAIDPGVEYT
jgi:hypothetical protein